MLPTTMHTHTHVTVQRTPAHVSEPRGPRHASTMSIWRPTANSPHHPRYARVGTTYLRTGATTVGSRRRLRILDTPLGHGQEHASRLRPRTIFRLPCGALASRRAVRTAAAAFDDVARQPMVVTRPLIIRRSRLADAIGRPMTRVEAVNLTFAVHRAAPG